MSTYVITGVSKGIGFGFLKHLSADPNNLIVGLVRDKPATEKKVAAELAGRSNIHILHGDLTDFASLKQAAADTASIVGERGVDYLIANAGYIPFSDIGSLITDLSENPQELEEVLSVTIKTNAIGNIHLINLFMPLVLKGKVKKVVAISSGHADLDFIINVDVDVQPLYAISKAALNVAMAKFHTQYKNDGVLFLSISPGAVDVGGMDGLTPEQLERVMGFMGKIQAYTPYFKGQSSTEEAIPRVVGVWERASLESGYGGAFVSHYGNKQWL